MKEACLAEKLAKTWSKKQILAAYLNEVFYGRHAFGAQAGAQTFFSTSARRLTLAQAALIAGLPQAPTRLRPGAPSRQRAPPPQRGAARDAPERRDHERAVRARGRRADRAEARHAVQRAAPSELLRLGVASSS